MNNDINIRVISQQDLLNAGCFDIASSIKIVEDSFVSYSSGSIIMPDKTSIILNQEEQNRINCLPAVLLDEKVFGLKCISVFPKNPVRNKKPNISAIILLSDTETGQPLALMDGSLCSNLRTAAVGAIGAKYLARKDSRVIGFIGAGEMAKAHFLSMKEVLPSIEVCKVSSRTTASEELFVEQMKRFYPNVEYVVCNGNHSAVAKDSDVIVTAISSQEKILKPEWIGKGTFYCHVAGLEDEFGVALKADKIVVDDWETVKHRTQTISLMFKQGLLKDRDIYANLDQIITGRMKCRENDGEFIYFNSVGLSYTDVALANWMYKKVIEKGIGSDINIHNKSMFD